MYRNAVHTSVHVNNEEESEQAGIRSTPGSAGSAMAKMPGGHATDMQRTCNKRAMQGSLQPRLRGHGVSPLAQGALSRCPGEHAIPTGIF